MTKHHNVYLQSALWGALEEIIIKTPLNSVFKLDFSRSPDSVIQIFQRPFHIGAFHIGVPSPWGLHLSASRQITEVKT